MKKVGWPMLYIFLLKPFKQWSFENFRFCFVEYFHKKMIVFHWKQFKLNLQAGREVKALNFYQYLLRACVRNPALSSKFLKTSLSRLVKQLNVENFKVVHEEGRLANVLLKLYRQWNFEKIQVVFFFGSVFLQKIIVFSVESIQN